MPISEDESAKKEVRVFISYSHKDEAWKDMLVTYLKPFVHQGDIVLWDDRKIGTGTEWYPSIKEQIDKADIAICLISADFLASDFINKEEIPDLQRRRKDEGMLLLPLLLSPCPWKEVRWLKGIQMFPRDGISLEEIKSKVRQKRVLAEFAVDISTRIAGEVVDLEWSHFMVYGELPPMIAGDIAYVPVSMFAPTEKVDITSLPETGAQLFGREKELQLLDEMWDSGSVNVVSLVAWGGVGKSTLVNQWLQFLKTDNYRGSKRVFGWSFYSQGTGQRVTSADRFISEALEWFGDPDPKKGSPWDKGERLVKLIRKEKTLLILDGLEPLQSGLDFEKGKINDLALSILVTQLARQNNGLCVITTREKVAELEYHPKTALHVDLEQISKEAARALLRVSGVQGTDEELEAASKAFGNHALAIRLLAAYLHGIEGHHISNAVSIPDLDIPDEKGRHPRRIIKAFEKRFGESPQIEVLYIMGLFDRPPDFASLEAVKSTPPIGGLTDKLSRRNVGQWHDLLDELRGYGLLAPKSKHNPNILDCHPLVREHFAEKLQGERLDAWREAHRRLFEHLTENTLYQPSTLEGLQPLYQAVAHGCQAGMYQHVLYKVYIDRILRGTSGPNAYYSTKSLGVIGSDLAALAGFFERPWTVLSDQFLETQQGWILNQVAFLLWALGLLTEALEPMRAGLNIPVKNEEWKQAAQGASNLSELELALGQANGAVQDAELSVDYADRSGNAFWRMGTRTTLGDVLFQVGEASKAVKQFQQAEAMQSERESDFPLLYSLQGFRYCDLLLMSAERTTWQYILQFGIPGSELKMAKAACQTVEKRARQTITIAERNKWLLDIALDHLTLGRATLYEFILSNPEIQNSKSDMSHFNRIKIEIEKAVDSLRHAGTMHHFPRGLLNRALLNFVRQALDGCRADLDEALQIAERGPMKLHMADVLLHKARLFRDKEALAEAEKLINECGYHRRDAELADAWEAAKGW